MQKLYLKFSLGVASLATLVIVCAAIDCYECGGDIGKLGGCGQDPWTGHDRSVPEVSTISSQAICLVGFSLLIFHSDCQI